MTAVEMRKAIITQLSLRDGISESVLEDLTDVTLIAEAQAGGEHVWDHGHHRGLISRKDQESMQYTKPPDYYAEGGVFVRYLKAIAFAFIMVAPYYTVLQSLGLQAGGGGKGLFVPCSERSERGGGGGACHYIQTFSSPDIPGTSFEAITVKNGIASPMHLQYSWFGSIAVEGCANMATDRSFWDRLFGGTCKHAINIHDLRLHNATTLDRQSHLTPHTHFVFMVAKLMQAIFLFPFDFVAKMGAAEWGMEYIRPARCPGKTYEQMLSMCKGQVGHVENILGKWTPAKIVTTGGLLSWALATAIHDLLLLCEVDEVITLKVGYLATYMLGIATVAMFMWGMLTAGVFVAQVPDFDKHDCVCYYRFHHLAAIVGLGTPFLLHCAFDAKVQAQGMAALFGDFQFTQAYTVPFYLARKSYLWTWGTLVSPKLAGTVQGPKRQLFRRREWTMLFRWHQALDIFGAFVALGIGLCLSRYMIQVKAYTLDIYTLLGEVFYPMKFVVMPLPSIMTLIFGAWGTYDLYCKTLSLDYGETFADQLNASLPDWIFNKDSEEWLEAHGELSNRLARVCFGCGASFWLIITTCTCVGFFPDKSVMLGGAIPTSVSLINAELWGVCGFLFFVFHFRVLTRYLYSRWDDIESLKNLAFSKRQYLHSQTSFKAALIQRI